MTTLIIVLIVAIIAVAAGNLALHLLLTKMGDHHAFCLCRKCAGLKK